MSDTFLNLNKISERNPFAGMEVAMLVVAFVICLIGVVAQGLNEHDLFSQKAIFRTGVVVLVIAASPFIWGLVRNVLYWFPEQMQVEGMGLTAASNELKQIHEKMLAKQYPWTWWKLLPAYMNASMTDYYNNLTGVYDQWTQSTSYWFTSKLTEFVTWLGGYICIPAYITQYMLQKFALAALPVSLSLLAIPRFSHYCEKFIGSAVSVLLWPFGFRLVDVMAGGAMMLCVDAANNMVAKQGAVSLDIALLLTALPLVPAGIMITGYLMVPMICYSLCTAGSASMFPGAGAAFGMVTRAAPAAALAAPVAGKAAAGARVLSATAKTAK